MSVPEQPDHERPVPLWQAALLFTLPVLTWLFLCGLTLTVLARWLPGWAAVPIAIVGSVLFIVVWHAGQGTSTALELNISSAILLVLLLLVVPIFQQAGKKGSRQRKSHGTVSPGVRVAAAGTPHVGRPHELRAGLPACSTW